VLTVRTSKATPAGRFKPVITATSGRIRRTRRLSLTVAPPPSQSISLFANPPARDVLQGDTATVELAVVRGSGLSGPVELSTSSLPPGLSAGFAPGARIEGSTATLTVTAERGAPVGTQELTVTAAAGASSARATVVLSVKETKPFTIAGDLAAPLVPGAGQPIDLTLTNPHDFDLRVAELTVAVAGTESPSCAPGNFGVAQIPPGRLPLTLAPGASTLTGLGLGRDELPRLELLDLGSNQDACQAARVELRSDGLATRCGVGPLLARPHDAGLVGQDHRVNAVAHAQLHEDPLHVGLDRGLLDHQLLGDLAVAEPARQQRQHVALARGQLAESRLLAGHDDRPTLGHPVDHPPGDRRRQQRLPRGHGVDGGDQVLGPGALQQEPGRAGAERSEDVLVVLERGHDQDAHVGVGGDDLARGGDAVEPGHADVHQHHVGLEPRHAPDRLAAVDGLPHHLDGRVARQDRPQPGAHEVVVVDQQDRYGIAHCSASA
jgi:hypothetical protein